MKIETNKRCAWLLQEDPLCKKKRRQCKIRAKYLFPFGIKNAAGVPSPGLLCVKHRNLIVSCLLESRFSYRHKNYKSLMGP